MQAPEPFHVQKTVFADPRTGRELWKISPDGRRCMAAYMYIRSFTADERFLFYAGECDGAWQLYRVELATGETMALTHGNAIRVHNANLHPATQELFYQDGPRIWAVHLETLAKRLVLDDPGSGRLLHNRQEISFSRSGDWFALGWSSAERQAGIARARCDGSRVEFVYERPEGEAQHLLYAGADDDLLSFSVLPDHQREPGDDAFRARTWLLDAPTGRAEPFLVLPWGSRWAATHEYWSPGGDRLYYHRKTAGTFTPAAICALDRITRKHQTLYESNRFRLGHSCVNQDETAIVSDVQFPGENPLLHIDLRSGRDEILCWPDSSVRNAPVRNDQSGHVHPSLSPSGRYVLYTSDVSGLPQVYVLPLR